MSSGGQSGKGGDVFDQSAGALRGAGGLYMNSANLYNQAGQGYRPATGSPMTGGQGFTTNAASAAAPQDIFTGIRRYMNPFTDQVINRAQSDVQRTVAQQQAVNNARATTMGAFGGSRAGIVEGVTNAEGQRTIAELVAGLRSRGFDTAAGLSAQDIQNDIGNQQFNAGLQQRTGEFNAGQQQGMDIFNTGNRQQMELANILARNRAQEWGGAQRLGAAGGLAGLGQNVQSLGREGFDIGRMITQDQSAQGGLQQALAQQVMNLAGGQYQQWQNRPQDMLSFIGSLLTGSPLNNNTTTTQNHTPGLFDYISLITNAASVAAQNASTAATGAPA